MGITLIVLFAWSAGLATLTWALAVVAAKSDRQAEAQARRLHRES